ncbi:hypothetical protein DPMN_162284 [Dreissena polymorpha]|uniref:Secreted protein n=1 Tax=Dreissena polymorpha TaxID=45954 RepID=A0A9D4EQA8_DREPO|nr:hypothetical protein DPMN_162284 [Dreissena polymorpha]
MTLSTSLWLMLLRALLTSRPDLENTRSDCTDVDGTDKKLPATRNCWETLFMFTPPCQRVAIELTVNALVC